MIKNDFPIIGAKTKGITETFDLTNPDSVAAYFEAKTGQEIEIIKKALANKNFIAFFVGKKNAGKGTYSKIFSNLIGKDKIVHLSVGDLVREVHADWDNYSTGPKGKQLEALYRGPMEYSEAVEAFLGRSASALLPSEFILSLLRVKFEELKGKSVFLDGFPRDIDQISTSLYFKEIVDRGDDIDMYILIDIPDSVINERIKFRRICPVCQAPRNMKLLPTSIVEQDESTKEFYLRCDNPACDQAIMVGKEGDELGIEPIKDRLAKDQQVIDKATQLSGIPIIRLRNSVPVEVADENFDNYELTPGFSYEVDDTTKKIKTNESPWTVEDNNGVKSYSLMPAPVVVGLLKQMAKVLEEK